MMGMNPNMTLRLMQNDSPPHNITFERLIKNVLLTHFDVTFLVNENEEASPTKKIFCI